MARRRRRPNGEARLTILRGDGHVAYRLLNDPELLDGWLSDLAARRRPMAVRSNAVLAMGLSMWSSQQGAEDANGWMLVPFDNVAEVRLDGDRGIWWARTMAASVGHYSVWGRPEQLQASVLDVHPL